MKVHQANKNNIRLGSMLALLIWLLQPTAHAQSDSEFGAAARECQRITELSARLACYDRILPPMVESPAVDATERAPAPVATPAPRTQVPPPAAESRAADPVAAIPASTPTPTPTPTPMPTPQQPTERNTAVRTAEPATSESAAAQPATARIVEVQTPSTSTTIFHAEDGRVFRRERATRIYRWPEPPFDVEIQTSRFGTVFLKFEDGLRVRVANRF